MFSPPRCRGRAVPGDVPTPPFAFYAGSMKPSARAPSAATLHCLLLLGALMGAAGPALANPDVEAGKQAFIKGEFRTTLARMEEASKSPTIGEADLVDIHWYRGASYYALGRKELADREFDALLGLRPLYTPNKLETPPDVRAAFKKRSEAYAQKKGVNVREPTLADGTIRVTVEGAVEEASVVAVFIRNKGEVRYNQFDFALQDRAAGGLIKDRALWERAARDGHLQVVVEVRNGRGTPLARAGDAQQPLELEVNAQAAQSALAAVAATEPKAAPVAPPEETRKSAPPADATPAPKGEKPAAQEGGGGPNVLGLALVGAGVGALVLSLLPALGFVASAVGAGLSGGLGAYTYQQAGQTGSDLNRPALEQQWRLAQVGVGVLAPAALAGLVLGALVGTVGIALVVAGVVL